MGEETQQEKQDRLKRERKCKHDYRADLYSEAVMIECTNCGKRLGAFYYNNNPINT